MCKRLSSEECNWHAYHKKPSQTRKVKTLNRKNKKSIQSDCMITDVENVIGPNRTVWP